MIQVVCETLVFFLHEIQHPIAGYFHVCHSAPFGFMAIARVYTSYASQLALFFIASTLL